MFHDDEYDHSLNNHILPVPYQLYKRSTRANSLRDKTSTLGDILQSLLLSSAVADKCRTNCQNANSSLTDFCLVLFWEHSPWWTSLFSSIFFVELSSREANPRCSVALLCDASPSTACWLVLFSFFFLLLPLLVHTDAHQVSPFHEFNIFAQWINFLSSCSALAPIITVFDFIITIFRVRIYQKSIVFPSVLSDLKHFFFVCVSRISGLLSFWRFEVLCKITFQDGSATGFLHWKFSLAKVATSHFLRITTWFCHYSETNGHILWGGVLFSLPGVNLEGITGLVVVVWVGPYANNPSIYSFCDSASLFLLI